MKTAISIDKKLFEEAEEFSSAAGISRSNLYCKALSDYIQKYSPDIITEKLNNYYEKNKSGMDDDLKEAANHLFGKEDW